MSVGGSLSRFKYLLVRRQTPNADDCTKYSLSNTTMATWRVVDPNLRRFLCRYREAVRRIRDPAHFVALCSTPKLSPSPSASNVPISYFLAPTNLCLLSRAPGTTSVRIVCDTQLACKSRKRNPEWHGIKTVFAVQYQIV